MKVPEAPERLNVSDFSSFLSSSSPLLSKTKSGKDEKAGKAMEGFKLRVEASEGERGGGGERERE